MLWALKTVCFYAGLFALFSLAGCNALRCSDAGRHSSEEILHPRISLPAQLLTDGAFEISYELDADAASYLNSKIRHEKWTVVSIEELARAETLIYWRDSHQWQCIEIWDSARKPFLYWKCEKGESFKNSDAEIVKLVAAFALRYKEDNTPTAK